MTEPSSFSAAKAMVVAATCVTPDCSRPRTARELPPCCASPHVTMDPSSFSAAKAEAVVQMYFTPSVKIQRTQRDVCRHSDVGLVLLQSFRASGHAFAATEGLCVNHIKRNMLSGILAPNFGDGYKVSWALRKKPAGMQNCADKVLRG